MTWWAIKRTEFTVSYADISIVKDYIVDECDCVAKYTAPQDICYKANRINIVRFDQSDAVFEGKSITCKGAIKDIANVWFTQKIWYHFTIISKMQMLTEFLDLYWYLYILKNWFEKPDNDLYDLIPHMKN